MRRILAAVTSAIVIVGIAAPAQAEWKAKDILELFDAGDPKSSGYLQGVSNGLLWANTMLASRGQKKLYCQPDRLALTGEQNGQILRDYLKRFPSLGTEPAGGVMLVALQDTFPCPG